MQRSKLSFIKIANITWKKTCKHKTHVIDGSRRMCWRNVQVAPEK